MPDYEYKFARVTGAQGQQSGVFGVVKEGISTTEVQAYSNSRGFDGWRIVAAVNSGTLGHYTLIFERERPPQTGGGQRPRKAGARKSGASKKKAGKK